MRVNMLKRKLTLRVKRKKRIRAKILGCENFPRISVFKSNKTLYIQAVDDVKAVTLVAVDGRKLGAKANKEGTKKIATEFAKVLKAKQTEQAMFDRNGCVYHGVIAALAESLREDGTRLQGVNR